MAYTTSTTNNYLIKFDLFNKGVDLAKMVAKRAESLLIGNGYNLKLIEGPETYLTAFEEIMNEQGLLGLLSDTERNLSLYGEQGVIVDLDGKKNLRFSLCDQQSKFYTTTAGKLIGARTYRKVTWGDGVYQIMEVWNNRGVKRTITNSQGSAIPISVYNSKVAPEMQIEATWNYSNLNGDIPIILFQNLNSVGNKSEADGANATVIQSQLDHALFTLYKETEMTRTRYAIDYGHEQTIKDIKAKGLYQTVRDSILFTDSDGSADGDGAPSVQVLANEFRGQEYIETIKFYQNLYFEASGYSPINDSMAQETVIGTLYTNKQDMETTRKKLKIREAQLVNFTALCAKLLGLPIEVHIKLKANIMFDEQLKLDYIRAGEEFEIMTTADKVKLFFNMTEEDEVEAKIKEIEEDQKRKIEMMDELGMNDDDSDNNSEDNNGGEE